MSVEHIEISAEEAFGAEVRRAREACDWTQDSLARHLREAGIRIDQAAVARMEKGKRPIRLNEASVLAQLLGLDLQAYGSSISPLTEDGYRDALEELEKMKALEAQASEYLASARRTVASRERDVAKRRDYRLRLEAAIRDYEERHHGQR